MLPLICSVSPERCNSYTYIWGNFVKGIWIVKEKSKQLGVETFPKEKSAGIDRQHEKPKPTNRLKLTQTMMAISSPGSFRGAFIHLALATVLSQGPDSGLQSMPALIQEAWTGFPALQPMSYVPHCLSLPPTQRKEPEALHLSWGGWSLNAKSRCGSLGRTRLWALILRDKGTRQQKTPYVKNRIKSEFFPGWSRTDWRRQVWGESDMSDKTGNNSLSHENTSKASLLKARTRKNRMDRVE